MNHMTGIVCCQVCRNFCVLSSKSNVRLHSNLNSHTGVCLTEHTLAVILRIVEVVCVLWLHLHVHARTFTPRRERTCCFFVWFILYKQPQAFFIAICCFIDTDIKSIDRSRLRVARSVCRKKITHTHDARGRSWSFLLIYSERHSRDIETRFNQEFDFDKDDSSCAELWKLHSN